MENVRLPSLPAGLLPPFESGQQRSAPRPAEAEPRPGASGGEDRVTLSAEGQARARRDVGGVVETVSLPSDRPALQAYREEAGRPVEPAPLRQGEVYEGVFQRLTELAAALSPPQTNPAGPASATEPATTAAPAAAPTIPAAPEGNGADAYGRAGQAAQTLGSRVDVFA
jgi:hypothetical protein